MTWRTISCLVTVLLAAVVVATTASSTVFEQTKSAPAVSVSSFQAVTPPVQERSSRVMLMIFGAGAVAFTFRRAFLNFRQPRM